MAFIIWLVAGGLIGWLAGLVMQNEAQRAVLLNVVVGVVGAMLGGWLIAPLFGVGTVNFSATGLMASLLGAVVLLAILSLFRRGGMR